MATPFVEGRIWKRNLTAEVESSCAHCGERIRFRLTGEPALVPPVESAQALIFAPSIVWEGFHGPDITHDF